MCIAEAVLATGECVIALADDDNVKAALEARGRQKIKVMDTRTFIEWHKWRSR